MAAEDALLHAQFLHLFQDQCGFRLVGPQHDAVHARVADDFQLMSEVGIGGMNFCSITTGWPSLREASLKLSATKTTVAIVHAQQRNSLQTQIGVDVPRQRVGLHAVVLQIGEVPGNEVSGMVGSVEALLTIGISARSDARSAICVVSLLIEPKIAQSLSSYTILTTSLLEAPQMAESLRSISLNGLPP